MPDLFLLYENFRTATVPVSNLYFRFSLKFLVINWDSKLCWISPQTFSVLVSFQVLIPKQVSSSICFPRPISHSSHSKISFYDSILTVLSQQLMIWWGGGSTTTRPCNRPAPYYNYNLPVAESVEEAHEPEEKWGRRDNNTIHVYIKCINASAHTLRATQKGHAIFVLYPCFHLWSSSFGQGTEVPPQQMAPVVRLVWTHAWQETQKCIKSR